MFNWFKKKEVTEPEVETPVEESVDKEKVYAAYKALTEALEQKKATKAGLIAAIEEAVVHLGSIAAE